MLRSIASVGLAVALVFSVPPIASGHGGQYLGPGDTVPPNPGGGDVTPPSSPGGPGTPAPGVTGGAGGRPSTGGQPGQGGGTPSLGAPRTGAFGKRRVAEGFERWEFWWEHNKEPFLDLRERLGSAPVQSGSGGFLTGRTSRNQVLASVRPGFEMVRERIVPTLEPLLQESHPDVVDSAVLALSKVVPATHAELCLPVLHRTLGHSARTARESATLALGVLGSEEAIPVLRDLMLNTPEGRRRTGQEAGVEDLVRAFAAISLGMIGKPETIQDLENVITDRRLKAGRDLQACALLALGLMPQGHEEITSFLLARMNDDSLDRFVRAQAPIALGKLNDPLVNPAGSLAARAAVGAVVSRLQNDKTDHAMGRSLANCLAMLATVEDSEAVDALLDTIERHKDGQTRNFAVMALARIGERDPDPSAHAEVQARIERALLQQLVKPRFITDQPYGALGLGVYARNAQRPELRERSIGKLQETFVRTTNPSYRGAMAVALGLLSARSTQGVLAAAFEETHDQALKGYLALSLGMMRSASHAGEFRDLMQKKGLEFRLRLQLARALGLMGDRQAVPDLVTYLESAGTVSEISSAAQALGLIGDQSAVEPLVAIASNTSKQPLTRGFACVALGLLAEKQELPWNTGLLVHSNYRAMVPAIAEIFDIP